MQARRANRRAAARSLSRVLPAGGSCIEAEPTAVVCGQWLHAEAGEAAGGGWGATMGCAALRRTAQHPAPGADGAAAAAARPPQPPQQQQLIGCRLPPACQHSVPGLFAFLRRRYPICRAADRRRDVVREGDVDNVYIGEQAGW